MVVGTLPRILRALLLVGLIAPAVYGCGDASPIAAPAQTAIPPSPPVITPPPTPTPPPETLGQKLRRLYSAAQSNNPSVNLPLKLQPPWLANSAYASGQVVSNGGNLYLALNNGVSAAAVGPTGTGNGHITDGTIAWSYSGAPPITSDDPLAPATSVTGAPDASLTQFVSAIAADGTQNSAAFTLGSNGLTNSYSRFLAASIGPKVTIPIASVVGLGNTVTVTTSLPHNYYSGLPVVAAGFAPAEFNATGGTPITVVDSTTYSYASTSTVSGAPATLGSVTVWAYGNSGANQDWFGSGYLQTAEDGQVTFFTDAPRISIEMVGSSRIAIDGRYIDLGVQANTGYPNFYNIDFTAVGGRKTREIRVECQVAPAWLGAYVAPGDSISAANPSEIVKAQFVGDSFFNGNYIAPLTISDEAGLRLGWRNSIPSNNGGSGFVAANYTPPTYVLNYLDRIADVKAIAPDVLIYVASGNDNSSSYSQLMTNMLACLQQARAWFPHLPIAIVELQSWGESTGTVAATGTTVTVTLPGGHGFSSGEFVTIANVSPGGYNGTFPIVVTSPTTFTYSVTAPLPASTSTLFFASRTAAAARNAVAQFNDPLTWFIPTISDPAGSWFTGSGNAANPVGDGNADFYVSPDGVHPEPRGATYLGARIAQAFANVLPKIP
jgi:hypothetical protein